MLRIKAVQHPFVPDTNQSPSGLDWPFCCVPRQDKPCPSYIVQPLMKPLPGILCKSADTLWHNPIRSVQSLRMPDAIRSVHQGLIGHNCHSCSSHTRTPGVSLPIWDSRGYSARYTAPFGHRSSVHCNNTYSRVGHSGPASGSGPWRCTSSHNA